MAKKPKKKAKVKTMMHNRLIKKEYWFSFGEIMGLEPYDQDSSSDFQGVLDASTGILNTWYPEGASTTVQTELLQMILRRYYYHYVLPCETDDDQSDEFNALKVKVLIKLTNIYVETKDRYSKLLTLYKASENQLLDGIKTTSTGVGRFNDTPQNVMVGEDEFIDNTHVSNISKQTGETITDADTKINRLNEIRRKYADLMKEWTDEFEDMFIESENIL